MRIMALIGIGPHMRSTTRVIGETAPPPCVSKTNRAVMYYVKSNGGAANPHERHTFWEHAVAVVI